MKIVDKRLATLILGRSFIICCLKCRCFQASMNFQYATGIKEETRSVGGEVDRYVNGTSRRSLWFSLLSYRRGLCLDSLRFADTSILHSMIWGQLVFDSLFWARRMLSHWRTSIVSASKMTLKGDNLCLKRIFCTFGTRNYRYSHFSGRPECWRS
jgi:hypothetical protein